MGKKHAAVSLVNPPTITTDLATIETLVDFLQVPQPQLEVTETVAGVAGGSTLGQVRKENQDRYLVARYSHPDSARSFLVAAIADGVGSLPESGLSASTAISAFVSALVTQMERPLFEPRIEWERLLRESVQQANRFVFSRTAERGASTFSAVIVPINTPPCAVHVGDSKIFGLSKDFHFTQLSVDHTVGSHLQSLGLPQGNLAGRDPRFDRSLAQYIGMADTLEPQFVVLERNWESILIATDGIAVAKRVLNEEGWNLISQNSKSRADFVRKILYLSNWVGGADNCTVVVLPLSKELMSVVPRRGGSLLSAFTGSRSIELGNRTASSSYSPDSWPTSDRKRQKTGKFKRGQKNVPQEQKPNIALNKSDSKPTPSITFLPGLAKDEHTPKK